MRGPGSGLQGELRARIPLWVFGRWLAAAPIVVVGAVLGLGGVLQLHYARGQRAARRPTPGLL